jgi:hypothetical protein
MCVGWACDDVQESMAILPPGYAQPPQHMRVLFGPPEGEMTRCRCITSVAGDPMR